MNPDRKKPSNKQDDDNANPKKKSRRREPTTLKEDTKDEEGNDNKIEMEIDSNQNPPETQNEPDNMQVDAVEVPDEEEIIACPADSSSSDESSNVTDPKKAPYVFYSTASSEDESADIIADYWQKRKENIKNIKNFEYLKLCLSTCCSREENDQLF